MNFEAMTQTELGGALEMLHENRVQGRFPYDGCRKVMDKYGAGFNHFTADFDMHYFDVLGCASSTKRFSTMPEEEVRHFQSYVERPFFEVYPQYQAAEAFITRENTPDLFVYMEQIEQMRVGVRMLLAREVSHQK